MTNETVGPGASMPARPEHRARALTAKHGPIALLLIATAVLYLWDITANQMGNSFYAASAWAGSENWKALLFGSLDPGNSITVDKPPVSQWVMGLSGRIFGFSSASMMIPQALMAVGTVALMYDGVRRIAGRNAGLIAGATLALTPVSALMFRYNNPDAAMVTLMTLGAYFTIRALEKRDGHHAGRRAAGWLALAGVALGFAFLAKMLEGLMVLPALGLAYLIAAPFTLGKRLLHLLGAAAAMIVSSGWYVVLTVLWPTSSRPYMAGSTDNSFMNLVLGYNGFGRVLGTNHHGGGGLADLDGCPVPAFIERLIEQRAKGHHGGFGSEPGLGRLFSGEFGLEVSFVLPAALLALILVLVSRGRAPRTDLMRAGVIAFGVWMLVDGVVLAEMKQQAHPYYSLSMVPGVAGTLALGLAEMWHRRDRWTGRAGLALLVATSGGWGFVLLSRDTAFAPPLRWVVLGATVVTVALVLAGPHAPRPAAVATVVGVLGTVAVLGGSTGYAISAVSTSHTGGGPTVSDKYGWGGMAATDDEHKHDGDGDAADTNDTAGGAGWFGGAPNPDITQLLSKTDTRWAAAINGSMQAAGLELATHKAVIAVGGFMGQDASPSVDQLRGYVQGHEISYYIVAQNGFGSSSDQEVPERCRVFPWNRTNPTTDAAAAWVAQNFPSVTVGGDTVYDLTKPSAAAFAK
ncbi:glycosyltransferase family 39 protein [Tsukamurella soli]|uniref:Glycosyltransferase family 39 protein n=1 Tax=Tsukamurella soli TaxID=644556 RepID=A0ABP8J000_9ACTN